MNSDILSRPLEHIKVRSQPEGANVLMPLNFQSAPLARALFTPHERRWHAALRAIGFGSFESFAAVFGKHLIAAPEALDAAATVYEQTPQFKRELLGVIAALGSKRDAELDKRVSELTSHASDATRALSIALSDTTHDTTKHRQPSDSIALAAILEANATVIEQEAAPSQADWSRADEVTRFTAGGVHKS
ncbi:hypothetical protein [Paraburkholderia aspalathi]|uniref:hypothetical protein n=1 Tax=Paraburkholderia aspalathi TaxID=1324617 RepID=UPI003C7F31B8